MSKKSTVHAKLPTKWGHFTIYALEKSCDGKEHVALAMGELDQEEPLLIRIHSECLTGDAFSSLRCDCGPQLEAAMKKISEVGRGMIVYLRQEGRGIGLVNKIRAYALQDEGQDTVEANINLGFQADHRSFEVAAEILTSLNVSKVKLMTNNPRKVEALQEANIDVVERVPLQYGRNPHNEDYLSTKHGKLGHFLDQ
ncbi:GTP cyclohydrolase II [Aliikangiella coralliicola]|uniref:GTP cyclohydrolase-2 n=1 Tax=Aliikangiella coralliicola TaxID=2592383 RepID=A0A545UEM7_9GAMM|nr:GTP cyclohydrolase II [Aliikangiella coralliicola]TQV87843.1 GTP cyclohydrolase II [Aliikangiella coralliicola]